VGGAGRGRGRGSCLSEPGTRSAATNSMHEGFYTADCYTGIGVATCQWGNMGYGFRRR